MFTATLLSIAGIGFFCWLLFTLAVYALPFFAAVTVGMWAHGTGAGAFGAAFVGLLAGAATLVAGQLLFTRVRSNAFRLLLALAFALPAAIAGYHAAFGISAIGVPSATWRHVFAVAGAAIVGFTAAARLMVFINIANPQRCSRGTRPLSVPEPTGVSPPVQR